MHWHLAKTLPCPGTKLIIRPSDPASKGNMDAADIKEPLLAPAKRRQLTTIILWRNWAIVLHNTLESKRGLPEEIIFKTWVDGMYCVIVVHNHCPTDQLIAKNTLLDNPDYDTTNDLAQEDSNWAGAGRNMLGVEMTVALSKMDWSPFQGCRGGYHLLNLMA